MPHIVNLDSLSIRLVCVAVTHGRFKTCVCILKWWNSWVCFPTDYLSGGLSKLSSKVLIMQRWVRMVISVWTLQKYRHWKEKLVNPNLSKISFQVIYIVFTTMRQAYESHIWWKEHDICKKDLHGLGGKTRATS